MQNNTYSYPIADTHTHTFTPVEAEQGEASWPVAWQKPSRWKFWVRSISNSEQMIKLVSKLQSSWRRQMQTIFWQRKSIRCLNLKHKSQRHWAEINITMLIVISRMVVLITVHMRQKTPSYSEHFSVQLSSPHTLSNCISWLISECRVGYLGVSTNWDYVVRVYLWWWWDWSVSPVYHLYTATRQFHNLLLFLTP